MAKISRRVKRRVSKQVRRKSVSRRRKTAKKVMMGGGDEITSELLLNTNPPTSVIRLTLSKDTFGSSYTLKIYITNPTLLSERCCGFGSARDEGYNKVLRALFGKFGNVTYPNPTSEVILGLADMKRRISAQERAVRDAKNSFSLNRVRLRDKIINKMKDLNSDNFVIEIQIKKSTTEGKLKFKVVSYPRLDVGTESEDYQDRGNTTYININYPKLDINARATPIFGKTIKYCGEFGIEEAEPKNSTFEVDVPDIDTLKTKLNELNGQTIRYDTESYYDNSRPTNKYNAVIE